LFSHEEVVFDDYPETKSVSDAAIYISTDGTDKFVGRVGSFVAVKEGFGGELIRVKGNTRAAVVGTKGYLWNEASLIKDHPERLDTDYYRAQCDKAMEAIDIYMPFDEFVKCEPN
jgi:hypothetical protein